MPLIPDAVLVQFLASFGKKILHLSNFRNGLVLGFIEFLRNKE
jgi:hypothetical protein